ncbi:MAG TPA: PAS domain S-box protein [bacterium]|nr:PAS domain S-box protein [bacterium]
MSLINILIVEDEKIAAEDLQIRLEESGYQVSGWSRSAEAAIVLATEKRPDLVLMDIVLEGKMSGIAAAEKIYRDLDIPVIFLTSHSDVQTLKEAESADAFAYLVKPVRDGEFQSAIQIALYKHQTERRIRKSEETYRVLVEGAGQPILKVDPEGRILFINQAGAALTGRRPEDFCGRTVREALSGENADKLIRLIRRAVETGQPVTDESVWKIGGQTYWFDLALYRLNERAEVLIIGRDVTDARAMKEALAASEDRYQKLFHGLPVGMYQCTAEGRILDANQTLVRMLGYQKKNELFDRSTTAGYVHSRDRGRWLRLMRRDGAVSGFETAWKRRDGSMLWVHETARAVQDASGRILYLEGMVEDITERKHAEEEIQHRLDFEMMVSKIAFRFIQARDIRKAVRDSLSRLGRFCRAERAYLFLFGPDSWRVEDMIEWRVRGAISHRRMFLHEDFSRFTFWRDALEKRTPIRISGTDELSRDAAEERVFMESRGIDSAFMIPVHSGERLTGVVGFDNAFQSLEWRTVDDSLLEVYAGILGNVFARQSMLESLRVSEQKFRGIFQNATIGIGLADSRGVLIEVNEALAGIFGFDDPSASAGRSVFNNRIIPRVYRMQARRGETVRFETRVDFPGASRDGRFRGPRGETVFLDVIVTPLPHPEKKRPYGYLVQVQDVSLRKQAEEDLISERNLLHALMDSIPDMIYFKDRQSRFTRINKALASLLGVGRPEEAVGKTDYDFFAADQAGVAYTDEQKLMADKTPQIGKQQLLKTRSVDPFWGSATKVPLHDQKGRVTGLVGITRDISDLKAVQENLEKTATALVKSNEELQNFAYVASHDLQEPLRMIASYLQLLKKRYAGRLDAEADEFIGYAVDGAARMQRLIQDILEYSRINTRGKPFGATDLNQVIQIVQLHLGVMIEETGAEILADPLPTITADSGQMIQLFQNLVGNALKFRGKEKPKVRIRVEENQEGTVFYIQDNGIGVEEEFHEQVFKLFRRLHSQDAYPGTGIGLPICKRIIERHGGRIRFDSRPGSGSTVSFIIPRHEAPNP